MEAGQPVASGIWAVETDLPYADDGHLVVDVRARGGSGLAARLPAAGIDVLFASADGSDVRAHLNIDQVEGLAADPDVLFIQPRQEASLSGQAAVPNLVAPTGQGSHSSEGDVTHLAFAARGAFHIDGTGLKIGVLSDGVRPAASQSAGDLGPVTGLSRLAVSSREHRRRCAMLRDRHDPHPARSSILPAPRASRASPTTSARCGPLAATSSSTTCFTSSDAVSGRPGGRDSTTQRRRGDPGGEGSDGDGALFFVGRNSGISTPGPPARGAISSMRRDRRAVARRRARAQFRLQSADRREHQTHQPRWSDPWRLVESRSVHQRRYGDRGRGNQHQNGAGSPFRQSTANRAS
jgi:hypothetical protein